jgi:hypothetical protein
MCLERVPDEDASTAVGSGTDADPDAGAIRENVSVDEIKRLPVRFDQPSAPVNHKLPGVNADRCERDFSHKKLWSPSSNDDRKSDDDYR